MSHSIALVFDDQFKGEEAKPAFHRMAGEVCSRDEWSEK